MVTTLLLRFLLHANFSLWGNFLSVLRGLGRALQTVGTAITETIHNDDISFLAMHTASHSCAVPECGEKKPQFSLPTSVQITPCRMNVIILTPLSAHA